MSSRGMSDHRPMRARRAILDDPILAEAQLLERPNDLRQRGIPSDRNACPSECPLSYVRLARLNIFKEPAPGCPSIVSISVTIR